MKRVLTASALFAVAMTAFMPAASADVIEQYESGYTSDTTCLYWYDYEGTEQGWIQLCGQMVQYGSYAPSRWVVADRSVRTCDANGQNCTDAYSERYSGPADAGEFEMDAAGGTASFNITLAGETDSCVIEVGAAATDSYTYNDPYPRVFAYGNPRSPYVSVTSEGTTDSAYAYLDPDYPDSSMVGVGKDERANINRPAAGSGTVCNWIEAERAGYGSMQRYANTSNYTTVRPGELLP